MRPENRAGVGRWRCLLPRPTDPQLCCSRVKVQRLKSQGSQASQVLVGWMVVNALWFAPSTRTVPSYRRFRSQENTSLQLITLELSNRTCEVMHRHDSIFQSSHIYWPLLCTFTNQPVLLANGRIFILGFSQCLLKNKYKTCCTAQKYTKAWN